MLIESKHASKSTRILRVYPQSLLIRVKKKEIMKSIYFNLAFIWYRNPHRKHMHPVTSLKSQTRCFLFHELVALRCWIKIIKHTKGVSFCSWHLIITTRKNKENVSLLASFAMYYNLLFVLVLTERNGTQDRI